MRIERSRPAGPRPRPAPRLRPTCARAARASGGRPRPALRGGTARPRRQRPRVEQRRQVAPDLPCALRTAARQPDVGRKEAEQRRRGRGEQRRAAREEHRCRGSPASAAPASVDALPRRREQPSRPRSARRTACRARARECGAERRRRRGGPGGRGRERERLDDHIRDAAEPPDQDGGDDLEQEREPHEPSASAANSASPATSPGLASSASSAPPSGSTTTRRPVNRACAVATRTSSASRCWSSNERASRRSSARGCRRAALNERRRHDRVDRRRRAAQPQRLERGVGGLPRGELGRHPRISAPAGASESGWRLEQGTAQRPPARKRVGDRQRDRGRVALDRARDRRAGARAARG